MINRKFQLLFEESLAYKDAGMLSSALQKREEATALMKHDKGHYALGKANEAILLGYHIGDGLAAYAAAKESLKDIEAFKETADEWTRQYVMLAPFNDILGIIRQWSESYETCIEYNRLRVKYFPGEKTVQDLLAIERDRIIEPLWWKRQLAIAYTKYSRESPEKDPGYYAQGMSILQCILERANNEQPGYDVPYEHYVHMLDDYIVISEKYFDSILRKYQAKHGLANTPDNPNELFIILKGTIHIWKNFMPDLQEKDKAAFAGYYQIYWLRLAMLHLQEEMQPFAEYFPDALMRCPKCGKQIPKISPVCRYCQKMLGMGGMAEMAGLFMGMPNLPQSGDTPDIPIPDLPPIPDFSNKQNPKRTTTYPLGCSVVIIIINLLLFVVLWRWVNGRDPAKWYEIFMAVICSIILISPLPLHIKNIFHPKK